MLGATADHPEVLCVAIRGRDFWLLEFRCPWCGRVHTHGGGPLEGAPDGGSRVSHCHAAGAPAGYDLVVGELRP